MSLLKLPEINGQRIGSIKFEVRPDVLQRWDSGIRAAADSPSSINIYEQIGESWDGSGMTSKRMAGILRSIGDKEISVNINSPGGDFFEGVSIYNMLRQHKARVIVNVMGVAASAASIVAMSGDDIRMGEGSFLMVHNAWCVAMGNRHDMQAAAEQLAPFDAAMAEVYAARTGMKVKAAAKLMDAETWISPAQAIETGFATGMLDSTEFTQINVTNASAIRRIEAALLASGMSRSAAQKTISEFKSSLSDSAGSSLSDSADLAASFRALMATIQGPPK